MNGEPVFAWPDAEHRFAVFALSAIFAVQFGLFYSGASLVAAHVPWRFSVELPLEGSVPFLPGAAVLYLAITPILCIAPFILRDLPRILPLYFAISVETAIAAVVFIAFPVAAPEPRLACEGLQSCAFSLADAMNLSGNNMPSLHVALVITSALAYSPRMPTQARPLVWLLCVAVVASTLLTRQHRVLDVVAGALLAWGAWRWARDRASRPATLERVDVELLCWQNYALFVRRNLRYLTVVVALLTRSLGQYRARRVLRTGFCFLQAVDDVLDGDRRIEDDPLVLTGRLIAEMRSGRFGDAPLSRLARAFHDDLLARGGPAAVDSAIQLIRNMQDDFRRASSGELWTEDRLERHHRETFGLSVDLMLCANGNSIRSADVPELLDAFGWCSTVRDLDDDLRRGLVNLPLEVLAQVAPDAREPRRLAADPAVDRWLRQGARRTLGDLDRVRQRLATARDREGARVLDVFARSIRRYAQRWASASRATAAQSPDAGVADDRQDHSRRTSAP